MKTTDYFKHTRNRLDRVIIKDEWIENVISKPLVKIIQSDGRIKLWGKIAEVNKYLRVILLDDGETIHNAFFDRDFK